ncbi:hypothetical protein BpHYR1_038955 [Brachionus plicatilis]|uniref:Uncharacterized protein n=1 Tax=Brachionus plicatilis TaxID=10195 RepID=A0A3M7Q9Q6_BRAPC|nr:hypothetical protein BpHYR1_038955 [Brachionus plicatilis]
MKGSKSLNKKNNGNRDSLKTAPVKKAKKQHPFKNNLYKHFKTAYQVYKTPCNILLILIEDKKFYLANYFSKGLDM